MPRNIFDARPDERFNSSEFVHPSGGDDPLCYSIAAACRQLAIGRTKLYEMFSSGELQYIKLGKRRLVERTALQRLVSAHRVGASDAK
jgi:excisionase family DNA binding protein